MKNYKYNYREIYALKFTNLQIISLFALFISTALLCSTSSFSQFLHTEKLMSQQFNMKDVLSAYLKVRVAVSQNIFVVPLYDKNYHKVTI